MEAEYTDHEYLVECTEGCGEITNWLQSRLLAQQAIRNHAKEKPHKCLILARMKTGKTAENRETDESSSKGEREAHHETNNTTFIAGSVQRDSG